MGFGRGKLGWKVEGPESGAARIVNQQVFKAQFESEWEADNVANDFRGFELSG